jgi:hypothetical protein
MLFGTFKKKIEQANTTADGFLPVLPAAEIIHAYGLSDSITQIKHLVAVPDRHFELYYHAPINEFLPLTQFLGKEFVQERLLAIIRGLKLRRPLLLPTGVESESIRQSKDLWTYVTFTALLLYNIGPAILEKIIIVKDSPNDKKTARRWHPLMLRIRPPQVYRVVSEQDISPYTNAYFLHRILPENCLHWIMQDSKAFNTVSELIIAPDPESPLGAVLLKAFNIEPPPSNSKQPEIPDQGMALEDGVDKGHPAEQPLPSGDAFYEWLKSQAISSSPPEPCYFNSSLGLTLVCPDIFKHYVNTHGGTWKAVQNDFLKLKRHAPNTKNNSDYHMLTIPGRGNVNTLILPGLSIKPQKN